MVSPNQVLLRDRSQVAFGQRYRLEVMLAVVAAEDGFVSLSTLAEQLNISISNLQGPVKSLVALGLLTPVPHGDSRHRFYLRNPSAAWTWAEQLHGHAVLEATSIGAEVVGRTPPGTTSQVPAR